MTRKIIICVVATMLTTSACTEQGKLQIRAIQPTLASGVRTVSFRVAEARGQFALGNVGLALESYRKAAREDPESADAFAGIAACYDRMGRFDLSRRNYEIALAIAPGDPRLLGSLAESLDAQHFTAEAASVRLEIQQRLATNAAPSTPMAALALQPVLPTTVANAVNAVMAASDWPTMSPNAAPSAPRSAIARAGPRLERVSLGEVALITTAGPQWRTQMADAVVRKPITGAAAVRQAAVAHSGLRLLNAARVDRLASRTGAYLTSRGWAVASVGDVQLPRSRSLILYPADKRAAAMRLSAQFGFGVEQRANLRQITILLGRDAASMPMIKGQSG